MVSGWFNPKLPEVCPEESSRASLTGSTSAIEENHRLDYALGSVDFLFSFKATVWSKAAWEWKLLSKVAFAVFMLLFRQNYESGIGLMMTAVFAQTPTVALLFEALAPSYKSLTSTTWHVANFAHSSCFCFYLFPRNENRLWRRRGRQERSCTMNHRESEKSHRPVELKQDQTRSLVDPIWSRGTREGSAGFSIYRYEWRREQSQEIQHRHERGRKKEQRL